MSAASAPRRRHRRPPINQRGTTAVEVAMLSIVFFVLIFGIIEFSRLLYVYNTLQDVTRRAAAYAVNVYPRDAAAIAKLKQQAIFRDSPGGLLLAPPVTDEHVRIDYLRFDLSVIPPSDWPVDAAMNRLICAGNPRAVNCIRFVQAQVCTPDGGSACTSVTSAMLIPLFNWTVKLTRSTTIAPAETLGYVPGTPPSSPPCPCP